MEKQVFQFTDYSVPVEIAGTEFRMDCSIDSGDYIKSTAVELRKLAQQVSSGEKTTEDVVAYGCGIIDYLLGDGAAETIMHGRKNKTSDVMDVCAFLVEVASKYRAEHQNMLKNRAQRRAEAQRK